MPDSDAKSADLARISFEPLREQGSIARPRRFGTLRNVTGIGFGYFFEPFPQAGEQQPGDIETG